MTFSSVNNPVRRKYNVEQMKAALKLFVKKGTTWDVQACVKSDGVYYDVIVEYPSDEAILAEIKRLHEGGPILLS